MSAHKSAQSASPSPHASQHAPQHAPQHDHGAPGATADAAMGMLLQLCETARHRPLTHAELAELNSHLVGLDATLGFRYTHVAHSRVVVEMDVDGRHLQPWGIVNGGALATLAESAGSLAGFIAAEDAVVMGVNNDTNFISAVSSGTVVAEATPIQLGRSTQLWKIDITQGEKIKATSVLRTMLRPA